MDRKKNIDLAIAILCAFIVLVTMFGFGDMNISLVIVVLAGIGSVIFFILYLTEAGKEKESRKKAKTLYNAAITELILLNEEEKPIAAWDMFGKTSLVIGKDIKENHVDINLNQSVYASMIDIEHAVLNYADDSWYIEDLGSKNGIVLQKKTDGRKYKLSSDQPCRLDQGDIIVIGLTKLLAR